MMLILVLLLGMTAMATAQQPQQPFEPFTVTQQDFQTLTTYLNDQPLRFSEPIMNWFRQKEAEAQKAKAEQAQTEGKKEK